MPFEDDLSRLERVRSFERGLRPLPIELAAVDWKRAQAPLKAPHSGKVTMSTRLNSPNDEGVLHFVTLSVRDRKRAFVRPEYAQMVLRELRYECDRHPSTLAAYVVMPDHVHLLIGPQDGKVTRFLARFKPGVTLKLDALAASHQRTKEREWLAEKGKRELWQDSKHSLPIYSPEWIREKVEYIHNNPVRAGLVENPGEFAFSSFGAYFPESGHKPFVEVDLVEMY